MYDDIDDDDDLVEGDSLPAFGKKPKKVEPKPEEISEHFCLDHQGQPALNYQTLGPRGWARISASYFSDGELDDFEERVNLDPKNRCRVSFNLGPDSDLGTRAERFIVRPVHRLADSVIQDRVRDQRPIRLQFCRLYLEVAPLGRVFVPRAFSKALRVINDEIVVGGLAPRLAPTSEHPPRQLHSSLLTREESTGPLNPARRRR